MQVLFVVLQSLILGAVAYVLGSLTCGLTICKWFKGEKFDIRNHGSNNVGFTNVWKVLGFKIGFLVLVADIAKSWVPVFVARKLGFHDVALIVGILSGGFGHGASVFVCLKEGRFSGGKSVATFFGGTLGAQPLIALIALGVWLFFLLATRYMFVASIMGGMATLVASICLGKGVAWHITFALVVIYLVIKHISNISRWLHGTELRITQKRDEVIGAFVVHPSNKEDLAQSPVLNLFSGYIRDDKGTINSKILSHVNNLGFVLECAEITGIVTKENVRVVALILAVPFLPEQIRDKENWGEIQAWLRKAAVQAQRRGATIIGLGGLLSTIGGGGKELADWLEQEGHTIKVDNGAAYTAASTIKAAEMVAPLGLSEMVVADVGARGFIGRAVGEGLKGKVKDIIPVVRDRRAKSDILIDFGTIATTDEIASLRSADMVVLCTNVPGYVIDTSNDSLIKKDAVVLDVAFPPDFDAEILKKRSDITLVRCGLILPPGNPSCQIDFHFGSVLVGGVKHFLIPACLAQCIMRGITGHDNLSPLDRPVVAEDVAFYADIAAKHGFEVVVSQYSEQQIYAGEMVSQ